MKAFARLLDQLAFTPSRNAKLTLLRDYLGGAPDPERGWALAALTGALSFDAAKPGFLEVPEGQEKEFLKDRSVRELSGVAKNRERQSAQLGAPTPSLQRDVEADPVGIPHGHGNRQLAVARVGCQIVPG